MIVSLILNITSIDLFQNIALLYSLFTRYLNHYKKLFYIFFTQYKNECKERQFYDTKINKRSFYKNKKLFNIHDLDVNKILVSKKESYGTKIPLKYFIRYNDDDDAIRPFCIKLSQMIGYVKHFDSNKTMYFKASDNKLLKKYTKIWERISNLMNKKFIVNLFMVIKINT